MIINTNIDKSLVRHAETWHTALSSQHASTFSGWASHKPCSRRVVNVEKSFRPH